MVRLASDVPETNKPRIHYVVFGDELGGGYGYWLAESEQILRDSIRGEKYIDDIRYGSFPTEKAVLAKNVLEEACMVAPELVHSSLDAMLEKLKVL